MRSTMEREISLLEALKPIIDKQWPLPQDLKARIDLGPFAAKNITDSDPLLADILMRLDYSLQHDGASIKSVFPKTGVRQSSSVPDQRTRAS